MLVFNATVSVEKDVCFDDRYHILFSDFESAWGVMMSHLFELQEMAGTEDVAMFFSDKHNWRKDLDPTYKAHRKTSRKPLAYHDVVDEVAKRFETIVMPGLEADDALGIYQTQHSGTAIWSNDKDLKQVPGLHLGDDGFYEITEAEGHRFHMYQTLVGDTADGYPGCPGVGDTRANATLNGPIRYVPIKHVLKTGKNKGQEAIKWEEVPADDLWDAVVSLYEKMGFTEDDALLQARLSRMLTKNDITPSGEVILWTPR